MEAQEKPAAYGDRLAVALSRARSRKDGRAGPVCQEETGPASTPLKERAEKYVKRPCRASARRQGVTGVADPSESLCHLGATPKVCAYEHVAARVPPGREGDKANRACPCHDDRKASLSINPGRYGQRIIWCCGAECDPGDIRAALVGYGVHESCLGRYGLPKRLAVPGVRIMSADLATVADAKRWQATRKLPAKLNASLKLMCEQALSEGDGDLPGDPYELLPVNRDDFLALANRSGIERGYAYRVYRQWMTYDAA
jgi:hypothetical protein